MHDKDFENFWNKSELPFKTLKDFAYSVWKAGRAPKPDKKQIELEGGDFGIYTSLLNNNNGLYRKTEADATKAAELMCKRDRLAAFVYEHCGFEGEFGEECNYYIYDVDGDYCYVADDEFPDLCKQYMPKDTAIWLCEKLNSGEIVL